MVERQHALASLCELKRCGAAHGASAHNADIEDRFHIAEWLTAVRKLPNVGVRPA